MKKLIVAGALSLFAFSSAAYACDGMKGQQGDGQTQANKDAKKTSGKTKKEPGGETTKS
jgi:hypothetical protein